MNDLGELKRYVLPHVRGQRIPHYRRLLDRIQTDGDGPDSWTAQWCAAAGQLERRGRHLDASRHYAMARFPYVDGPARQEAQDRCVAAFDRWRRAHPGIERLDIDLPEGRIHCLASGLADTPSRPLLLLMGGIVSLKEQNAAALANISRLGMAGLVAELPGVGENPLRYGPDSWQLLSGLLDALAGRANVEQTYPIAMSFSGHLALRCALDDSRIKGVVTVGAPISEFFTDTGWQRKLPHLTVGALAHMIGVDAADVADRMRGWGLGEKQLAALTIPVCYAASLRDEIIPPGDVRQLREHVRRVEVLEYDDVHGAPRHIAETRLWSTASVLRMRGVRNPQSRLIEVLWQAQRARALLTRRSTGFSDA